MRQLVADLRHSVRALGAKPGFVLLAVLTLALGIGANTAVYSVFQQLVTRPLPVPSPEALVNLSAPGPKNGPTNTTSAGPREDIFSLPMLHDLQAQQTVFTGIAAHQSMGVNIAFRGQSQAGRALLVSPEYFPVLGLQPALGRLLGPQDQGAVGEPRVAVLSHAFWANELGAAPDVLNRTLRVNGQTLTIVGVAPAGFDGTTRGQHPRVFLPLSLRWLLSPGLPRSENDRNNYWLYLFARLQPGVTTSEASAQLNRVYTRLISDVEVPLQGTQTDAAMAEFKAKRVVVSDGSRGQSNLARDAAQPIGVLLAVAGLILLIACMNTANLMLARAASRTGEMAVRMSIGASTTQLLRQQLIESAVLASCACLVAYPVALLALRGLVAVMPPTAASAVDVSLDAGALGYAALVAAATVLVFGLVPALHAARTAPMLSLKSAANQAGVGKLPARFRATLATAQIAVSLASLVVAGLFVGSLAQLGRVDLGMQTEAVTTFVVSPVRNGYNDARSARLYDLLEQTLATLPGVSAVTSSNVSVLSNDEWSTSLSVEGYTGESPPNGVPYNAISESFLDTLGIRLLAGREFSAADGAERPKVAIVNRQFAKSFGLGEHALGKRISMGEGTALDTEIVGVVEDARYSNIKISPPPQFYLPRRQNPSIGSLVFYVRSAAPDLSNEIRAAVARLDPDLPVENLSTLPQNIAETLATDIFVGRLSGAFAILATLLAALGVYGLLSYSLTQRTREIGLRLALGAAPAQVQALMLRQVLRLFAIGGAIGLALALAAGRAAQGLLFELDAHDPRILVAASLLLATIALLAGWLPARRGARIDPLVALRWE